MKFIYLISFISIFQLLYSIELGGIKFAITEKMAYNALDYFYPDINKEIISNELEDINVEGGVNIREIKIGIPNFTTNKVRFTFRESGININISGLKAWIKGTAYISKLIIPFHQNFEINSNEFSFNANLRVFTKKDGNRNILWAEYAQAPSYTLNFNFDNEEFMKFFKDEGKLKFKNMMKNAINDFIMDKADKFLDDGLYIIPTVMPIDESKGLFIDYSLVENIKMKNGYFEVNSYAFFYNTYKSKTTNKKNFPLSLLPPITTIDNPNQLFVSQYSINSALYTYFVTNPLSLKIDVNNNILNSLFPSFLSKFSGQQSKVYLEIPEPPTLEFEENYISGDIKGKMNINVEGRNQPIFSCSIELPIKVEIVLMQYLNISGKIKELDIKLGSISVNEENLELKSEYTNSLMPIFSNALNDYISKNVKFTLPSFFQSISVKYNNKYITINYYLNKFQK